MTRRSGSVPILRVCDGGVSVASLHLGTHSGTHIDAPLHVGEDRPSLDQVPLDQLIGRPCVVDLRSHGGRDAIGPVQLQAALGTAETGDILLLHTGWSRHWDTPRYLDHPYLSAAGATAIVDAGIRCVGVDALSVDVTPDDPRAAQLDAHLAILGSGAVIIENLQGLDRIASLRDPLFLGLPLPLAGADGSPARAVAVGREP